MVTLQRTFLVLLAILLIGCGDETESSNAGTESSAVTDSLSSDGNTDDIEEIDAEVELTYEVGGICQTSSECAGGWCDKAKGGCVDCFLTAHCEDDEMCMNGVCVPKESCGDGESCTQGICLDSGDCGDCQVDSDCADGLICVDQVCRPPFGPCESDADCEEIAAVCDASTGSCVDCKNDSQCGNGEYCKDKQCYPNPCNAGEANCVDNDVQICRSDGLGYYLIPCAEELSCLNGQCLQTECTPGVTECLQHQVKDCTPDGKLIIKNCPPNQECIEGACAAMRQRVLVIFDTSGSMNAIAAKKEWPNYCSEPGQEECLTPWPECEDNNSPFTVSGISKKVFSQFFKSDDTQNVLFGLQRFPQRAVASAPVCEGGYYQGDTLITDDPGAHTVPLGIQTFLDKNLHEIVLVEFPKETGSNNLLSLIQWLDFKETLFETTKTCFQTPDCSQGVCLGPIGNKKCHTFTNPELRAHGWTPLGQSLFYAGEYLRRDVIVDGKACTTSEDCGSPGYYCNEVGKCYDPLKECRLNVIVLFTDGGETQWPFTNSYFNPAVQAKRLRYGLACQTDEDCSAIPFCRPVQLDQVCSKDEDCLLSDYECNVAVGVCEHKEDQECFPTYCNMEKGTPYCTNELIETQGAPPITFTDQQFSQDRLLDYNGNPINVIVNVVDASVSAEDIESNGVTLTNNYQIALHGGGLHVLVSVEDEADFLAKLKASIDAKSLFGQCSF